LEGDARAFETTCGKLTDKKPGSGNMKQKQRVFEIKNPRLDRYHILLHEALLHSANGYIGVRYDLEEGYPDDAGSYTRSQYINGFYELSTLKQPENLYGLTRQKETMLNVADTQTIRLFLEDEEFSVFHGTVQESSLTLDMDKGVMVRRVLWRS
jgi:alpha,alpha-trehalose phosphorylase